jgi:NAD(P)-dependent dehydrogenase (short-subunit alcohol dehydrogenase family)
VLPAPPQFRLDGRQALVTGASRGIGLAAAAALADAGAEVTLVARQAADLEAACAAIRARGGRCHALVLDVTDSAAVDAARAALHAASLDCCGALAWRVPLDAAQCDSAAAAPVLCIGCARSHDATARTDQQQRSTAARRRS